jgi:hypothetical protein
VRFALTTDGRDAAVGDDDLRPLDHLACEDVQHARGRDDRGLGGGGGREPERRERGGDDESVAHGLSAGPLQLSSAA